MNKYFLFRQLPANERKSPMEMCFTTFYYYYFFYKKGNRLFHFK